MADDPNTPGSVPPKVSPIQPATPGAPRPITVRLKKPVITPAAPAPVADPATAATIAPAEAATAATIAPAPSAAPSPISPITPAAPAAPAAGGLHAITIPKAKPVMPGGMPSASPIRPAAAPAAPASAAPSPIAPAAAPVSPAPLKPIAVKPALSQPPVPGSNPLPSGPKPPSEAQVQAAKSKTSRISLDSAIGVAPVGNEPAKTIRLKRPSALGTPPAPAPVADKSKTAAIRQTSRIPDSAIPSAEATTTQKKTLKIKRPGTMTPLASPGADESAEPKADANEGDFTNLKPLDFGAPARSGSPVATAIALTAGAIAALIVLGLTFCLGSQAMGPDAGPNALASVKGPILPWTSSK